MAVTIRHVAEEAGVYPGTVSRALRGHPQVSAECPARVRAVADRLGYNPLRDHSGRSQPEPLAGKRIAIVMFGIDRALASLPVVAEAIHGAEEALAEAGAHPVLIDVPDPAEPPRSLRPGLQRRPVCYGGGCARGRHAVRDAGGRLPAGRDALQPGLHARHGGYLARARPPTRASTFAWRRAGMSGTTADNGAFAETPGLSVESTALNWRILA